MSSEKFVSNTNQENRAFRNNRPITCHQYDLSSWNYGSFYPIKPKMNRSQINLNQQEKNNFHATKSEKRRLTRDEKIIKDDQIKNMQHLKRINTSKNISNRPSSSNPFTSMRTKAKQSSLNSQTMNDQQAQNAKFKLNYDEWLRLKIEQEEIERKIKIIKENEYSKLQTFDEKIKKEYQPIKEEKFRSWLDKKKREKAREEYSKLRKEQEKLDLKLRKEEENNQKLELWIKRQALIMEAESKINKEKKLHEKRLERKKEKSKEIRKQEANEAFRNWMERKEKEVISNASIKESSRIRYHRPKPKVIIGPYSIAKNLKDIQRQIEDAIYNNPDEDLNEENEAEEEDENQQEEGENLEEYENQEEEDNIQVDGDVEIYENFEGEDKESIPNLSQINKETPNEL